MSEKLDIFGEPIFDESIWREEDHTYHPQTSTFGNNDEIDISINQQDALISFHDGYLGIECTFNPVGLEAQVAGGGVAGGGACTLSNNCAANLFERVSYELNGCELDVVRDPGMTTAMAGLARYGPDDARALATTGWDPARTGIVTHHAANNTINFRIPLPFLFNIFNDYRRVLMGRHKFRLVRRRTDDNCYVSTGTSRATFNIQRVFIKVRHVCPNDEFKLQLLKSVGSGATFKIPFRRFELHELPALRAANKDVWPIKTSLKLEKPTACIVAYQTNRRDNPSVDSTRFDNIELRNIKLWLNSVCYPFENQNFDFTTRKYVEAYAAYSEFAKGFFGKSNAAPILNYVDFGTDPIFIIDCSKQIESLQSATVDVKLEFESANNFPANTRAYALIIHDKMYEYSPLQSTVREIQ